MMLRFFLNFEVGSGYIIQSDLKGKKLILPSAGITGV
jgi:hypothetical protein